MTVESPVTLCGKYVLQHELAHGGMGTIWVAKDPELGRRVAVKRLRPDVISSPRAADRFRSEARAVALLQSPHVVQVYDFGFDDQGAPFLVMELLEGHDFLQALRKLPRWSVAALTDVISQVAKGLSTAHAAGVVHRDLKPGNIFLARAGGEEVVKVLDFGVASTMIPDLAASWEATPWIIAGTPHYMSPEQARGRTPDPRSDLWSLAVVAYQALTSALPFNGSCLGDMLVSISSDPFTPPSALVPSLNERVDAFFARALARDPGDRFQSAREMAAAFAALNEPASEKRTARILVVDDEPQMIRLVRQRFREQVRSGEYELLSAEDGEAALEVLRRNPDVDVVLSDIRMPRMDGLTFLKHAAQANPIVRTIMISAFGDMPNIRQAMNRGAFDFLVKPVDLDDLKATVERAVSHTRELRRATSHVQENSVLRMFVHSGVIDRLLPALGKSAPTTGEVFPATIVVIGIHGLLDVVDRGSPLDVFDTLNGTFEAILPEIAALGGALLKLRSGMLISMFQGDRHAERAVQAAIAARAELLRRGAVKGGGAFGRLAIGIESGPVMAGTVGSKRLSRLDYTVVGRAVLVAFDLARSAGQDEILAGEQTRAETISSVAMRAVPGGSAPPTAARLSFEVMSPGSDGRDPTSHRLTVALAQDEETTTAD